MKILNNDKVERTSGRQHSKENRQREDTEKCIGLDMHLHLYKI
jgi:hypothetical protein